MSDEYFGTCEICKQLLADYEQFKLDCGHYACNSCCYQDSCGVTRCEACKEKREVEE